MNDQVLAEKFLVNESYMQALSDAVLTGDEFREFCNAFGIPPVERLKIAQKVSETRVPLTLKVWFQTKPTVADLRDALQEWKHQALLVKLDLTTPLKQPRPGGTYLRCMEQFLYSHCAGDDYATRLYKRIRSDQVTTLEPLYQEREFQTFCLTQLSPMLKRLEDDEDSFANADLIFNLQCVIATAMRIVDEDAEE